MSLAYLKVLNTELNNPKLFQIDFKLFKIAFIISLLVKSEIV